MAGYLETRVALSVGGCVCLALVGISWSSIHQREQAQSPVAVTDHEEAARPSEQAANSTSFHPVSFDTTVHAASPDDLDETFVVRVGSFRDPYNAARLRRLLLEQTSDVRTATLPGGLYVVELGPFSKRDAAERTAQSLRQDNGLSPQVVQRDTPAR